MSPSDEQSRLTPTDAWRLDAGDLDLHDAGFVQPAENGIERLLGNIAGLGDLYRLGFFSRRGTNAAARGHVRSW
jgi:hypothetical protein